MNRKTLSATVGIAAVAVMSGVLLAGCSSDDTPDAAASAPVATATADGTVDPGAVDPNAAIEPVLRDAAAAMDTAYADTGAYPETLADAGFSPEGDADVMVQSVTADGFCLVGASGASTLYYDSATNTFTDQPCS